MLKSISESKKFEVILDTTRNLVVRYTTDKGVFFFKTYQNDNEKNILGYIMNTGLTEVIKKDNFFFIEREIKYKKIDDLNKNIGSILAKGYNKLHENMILYNDFIDEHWFYDENTDIIKMIDFGNVKLNKNIGEDIYIAHRYLSLRFDNNLKKNWNDFKENYKFKDELKKFENKYLNN